MPKPCKSRIKLLIRFCFVFSGFICFRSSPAQILDEPLDHSSSGNVLGGRFVGGGGWTPEEWNDMIIYDLRTTVSKGRFQIDVRNFDPRIQNSIERHHILSMYTDEAGDHNHPSYNRGSPEKSVWNLHTGTNYRGGIKFLSIAGNKIETHRSKLQFSRDKTYKLKVIWDQSGVELYIDGNLINVYSIFS